MSKTTIAGGGTGTPAAESTTETIVIVRDWQPGRAVRVVCLTPEQLTGYPTIPPEALQIIIEPNSI